MTRPFNLHAEARSSGQPPLPFTPRDGNDLEERFWVPAVDILDRSLIRISTVVALIAWHLVLGGYACPSPACVGSRSFEGGSCNIPSGACAPPVSFPRVLMLQLRGSGIKLPHQRS
ncbi:hypothetical protein UPYG_G00211030 [Umbra pygmaea]|uniref:Uncharacterized protein n=1 Tax=Umbra pygmaea TaxID=75934 RepID=A0ABD0X1U3_UMBPY